MLRSHSLLHVAEGQLVRETLTEAAYGAGLGVHYLAAKGTHNAAHTYRAAEMRNDAGPPWRKGHKLATVAALSALSASAR